MFLTHVFDPSPKTFPVSKGFLMPLSAPKCFGCPWWGVAVVPPRILTRATCPGHVWRMVPQLRLWHPSSDSVSSSFSSDSVCLIWSCHRGTFFKINSLHIPQQESNVSTSKHIFPIGPLNNAYGWSFSASMNSHAASGQGLTDGKLIRQQYCKFKNLP